MDLENHPSVIAYRQRTRINKPETVTRQWIKEIVMEAGADDVGVVDIDRAEIAGQKAKILTAFPTAKTLISFICRMNPSQFRASDRSLADGEFIAYDAEMLLISRKIVRNLRKFGIEALTPSESFPQDMAKPREERIFVSHKPVAVAAGLGHMGHHRILIHPVFGSHLCLGTIIMDTELDGYDSPVDFNPCISCILCVSVCPTGAIKQDGSFNFLQCLVHAYRDRLGGFLRWVEALVTSDTMEKYRTLRDDNETMAVWQSLTYGGGYRCGYCMSVCPAGVDIIGSYIDRKKEYVNAVVKPLRDRKENVQVLPDSDSGERLRKHFPNKTAKPV
jgi:ferredoxin